MIVRTETTGLASANVCRFSVVMREPSIGKRLSLVRTTLPRLPFRYARQNQVLADGVVYSLPDARTLAHLAEVLSGLIDAGGKQVLEAFYSNNEFEICAGDEAVVLDADLAAALGVPVNIAAGECVAGAVDEEEMNESDYYRATVEYMKIDGFFEDGKHTQIIDEFRQAEELPQTEFTSKDNAISFGLYLQAVNKDGTVVDIAVQNTERICAWVKVVG